MVRILLFVIMMASIDGNAIELSCENANETIVNQLMSTVKTRYSNVEFYDLSVKVMGTELPITCDVLTFEYPKKIDLKGDVVIKFNSYKDDQFQKRATKVFRLSGYAKVLRTNQINYRGNDVLADQVYEDQISIDKVTMHTISSIKKDDHMQFRNYVEKDQIIEAWMMEKKPDSVKGEQVKAIIKKAKITLTLDAHLLENGYIGNNIKVALSKNNKVLLGTLHDKKTVIISSL